MRLFPERSEGAKPSGTLFELPPELACPACLTLNVPGVEVCCQCGCELGVLWEIQQAAAEHLAMAGASLERGDGKNAFAHARRSWELQHSAQSAAVAAMAAAVTGDTDGVAIWTEEFQRFRATELRVRMLSDKA